MVGQPTGSDRVLGLQQRRQRRQRLSPTRAPTTAPTTTRWRSRCRPTAPACPWPPAPPAWSASARSRSPSSQVKAATDPRPGGRPRRRGLVSVVVQNTYADLALSGTLHAAPRRSSPTRSATSATARWARPPAPTRWPTPSTAARATRSRPASVCHDANKVSSTVMTNGLALNESYQFKRMIHGIHGNSQAHLSVHARQPGAGHRSTSRRAR